MYLTVSERCITHYNPRVTFLVLLVQLGLDVWRREKRGERLLGHTRSRGRELAHPSEGGNNLAHLLCLAAEDSC